MLKHYFIGILLTILLLSINTGRAKRNNGHQNNTNGEFDQFALAQIWPQTSCWELNYKSSKLPRDYSCSPCKLPSGSNDWTVHGLWPNSRNGRHPFFCDNSAPLDLTQLNANLRVAMKSHWPTYKMNVSDRSFWQHEWTKHGTCAMQVEATGSQEKYFAKALQLLEQYNVGDVLGQSGVTPGYEYNLDTINGALKKALGVNVSIWCARLPGTEEQCIEQVLMCFDKNFNLADCYDSNPSNCDKNRNIVYPSIARSC